MFKKLTQENLNSFLLGLVALLILLNGISIFRNNQIIINNNQLREDIAFSEQTTASILTRLVQATDVAVRGYAITEQEIFINAFDFLYKKQNNIYPELIKSLDKLGVNLAGIRKLEKGTLAYIDFSMKMVKEVQLGNMDKFKEMLAEGRGDQLYEVYVVASGQIFAHMNKLNEEAMDKYSSALKWNKWLQITLLVLSLPTIISVILRIRKETKDREKLYGILAENNHKHLFNPGKARQSKQDYELERVLETSIENMQQASDFVTHIAEGNYEIHWNGLHEQNEELNTETLAGALMKMRDKMKNAKESDQKHLWVTDGLAEFSKLVRNHQHDLKLFANELTAFLVKYLGAQQGALFLLNDSDEETYLQLEACYAFDRKKFIEKRVEPGNGLVGQAYLEKLPIVLTEIPNGYTYISSGLGDATPKCLIIMPFQYNEKIEAVIEIASFKIFETHQKEFLSKAGEFVASTIINLRTSAKMKEFVKESTEKNELMQSQEEELRQNMEEMNSTQEEMSRREKELLAQLASKEELIKQLNKRE